MNTLQKISLSFLFLSSLCFFAQGTPENPPPPGGGTGVTGTGSAPNVPIDMHLYLLVIVAILMIVYFARKFKTQKL